MARPDDTGCWRLIFHEATSIPNSPLVVSQWGFLIARCLLLPRALQKPQGLMWEAAPDAAGAWHRDGESSTSGSCRNAWTNSAPFKQPFLLKEPNTVKLSLGFRILFGCLSFPFLPNALIGWECKKCFHKKCLAFPTHRLKVSVARNKATQDEMSYDKTKQSISLWNGLHYLLTCSSTELDWMPQKVFPDQCKMIRSRGNGKYTLVLSGLCGDSSSKPKASARPVALIIKIHTIARPTSCHGCVPWKQGNGG